jgi:hypothetical protein
MIRDGLELFKRLGSDYLRVEFGWKPFIADIQNAAKSLAKATAQLSQQGKRVHRRYSLPPIQESGMNTFTGNSTWFVGNYAGFSGLPSGQFATSSFELSCEAVWNKSRFSSRWFEGEFSSFMPLGFDPNDYLQRLNALVSVKITPSVLWELTPWSWLVDWYLKIQDTIRANELNANDLLVMHYGYAMEHTYYNTGVSFKTLSDTKPNGISYSGNRPKTGYLASVTEYQRRLRANPYGFRTGGTGGLSVHQGAILGALGLTKLK